MRLVDHGEKVLREKVEQRERLRSRRASAQVPRVVFDAAAKSHLLHHFEIVFRALLDALRLDQLPARLELGDPLFHFLADRAERAPQLVGGRDELFRRVKRHDRKLLVRAPGERIEPRDAVDLVAEKLHPDRLLIDVRRMNLDDIAAHAEPSALKRHVVPLVEHVHEFPEHRLARNLRARFQREQHVHVILRRPQAVDARHARDDDHVAPREERTGRREPQPLDLLVDGRVLLDVGVRAGDVRLGLVVIEVADEVFDRVVGEELLELGVELRGERFVVRDHKRRAVEIADDVCHRERLSRAGDAEQRLVAVAGGERFCQLRNRLRLVALGLVLGCEGKRHGVSK